MLQRILLLICLTISLFSPLCYAQTERILKFSDTIIVHEDASIEINEAISVYANQEKFIHGLKRQLPTTYTDSYGRTLHTMYQIVGVMVNSKPTTYHIEFINNQMIIYIGDKNILLTPGVYRYDIKYRVDNAINFLQDADELYWNITGNDWDFTIEKAEAYIQLPKDAEISNYMGYTGARGAQGKAYKINQTGREQIEFVTTAPLSPGEGLTVAVAWQKGVIKQPTFWELLKLQFRMNRGQTIVLEICLLLFAYYLTVWNFVGRDPKAGVVIPLFEPPANLPPADMRFILHKGYDLKCFSAAIISMATKGFLRINQQGSDFSLTRLQKPKNVLAASEQTIPDELFRDSDTLFLKQKNSNNIDDAQTALKDYLKDKYQGQFFITNSIYLWPGIILTLLAFLTAYIAVHANTDAVFAMVWLTGWSVGCFILCYSSFIKICSFFEYPTFGGFASMLYLSFFALIFLIAEILVLSTLMSPPLFFSIPLLFISVLINVAFYYLLKAPTPEGRKVMDKILGFKMYLGTTERYRLDMMNPPEKTPELFEKYLPYAIALNVPQQWAAQFTDVLKTAGTQEGVYRPAWYAGPGFTPATLASFPAFIDSSLTNTLASTTVSGSASGGGGSSGGGGGGGGGGGW